METIEIQRGLSGSTIYKKLVFKPLLDTIIKLFLVAINKTRAKQFYLAISGHDQYI